MTAQNNLTGLIRPGQPSLISDINIPGFFENRVCKDKDSFYYLAIKNNKIRPKPD